MHRAGWGALKIFHPKIARFCIDSKLLQLLKLMLIFGGIPPSGVVFLAILGGTLLDLMQYSDSRLCVLQPTQRACQMIAFLN